MSIGGNNAVKDTTSEPAIADAVTDTGEGQGVGKTLEAPTDVSGARPDGMALPPDGGAALNKGGHFSPGVGPKP